MLNIEEIAKLLVKNGSSKIVKKETGKEKAHEYSNPELYQSIYINLEAGEAPSGLIIHPINLYRLKGLKTIDGVINKDIYSHKATLKTFPKRVNDKVVNSKPIHHGIPFGFVDEIAFDSFFNQLKIDDCEELDDINDADARGDLSGSATDNKALVDARLGHGKYKRQLVKLWGQCSVTKCIDTPFLKASHIKPWRDSNNIERLDPFNGLLLIPNLDTAFDRGFITFQDDGAIKISSYLAIETQKVIGINKDIKVLKIKEENKKYLEFHRDNVFENFIINC